MNLLDTAGAAEYLSISRQTLFRHMRETPGFPRGIRVGKRARRFTKEELDRYLEQRRIPDAG